MNASSFRRPSGAHIAMPFLAVAIAVACISFDALLSTAHSESRMAQLERTALGP